MIAEAANSLIFFETCTNAVLAGNGHVSNLIVQVCLCRAANLLFLPANYKEKMDKEKMDSQWREHDEHGLPSKFVCRLAIQ